MAFDTNWDVEKYKSPFECEEHWELRRSFLVAHQDKYPEDQLVCLAQVFFNVELLGCKYPDETMALIAELSEGIADAFRAKKEQKLQRTFVKASDAAGAKIKGLSVSDICSASEQATAPGCVTETIVQSTSAVTPDSNVNNNVMVIDKAKEVLSTCVVDLCSSTVLSELSKDLVIQRNLNENFFDHGVSIIQRSLAKRRIVPQYEYHMVGSAENPIWTCAITIPQNHNVAEASATSKQVSRKAATEALLNSLQKTCYTVVEKTRILSDGSTVDKNIRQAAEEPKISENNVGNKMMKLMGWKGGGLGKMEQGRAEPVVVQDHVRRSGLGEKLTQQELMKKLHFKLKTYAASQSDYDLVFSSDFSKDERAKLHAIAQRFHLKTRSYGSGNDRHLVVSKRATNYQSTVENLLNCGGENERYQLILPLNFEESQDE